MGKPPFFILISAASPSLTVNIFIVADKVWISEPIVTGAFYGGGISPVIIGDAVGSIVDVAAIGFARSDFVIKGKFIPRGTFVGRPTTINLGHSGFSSMAEIFKHKVNSSFKIKAHDG